MEEIWNRAVLYYLATKDQLEPLMPRLNLKLGNLKMNLVSYQIILKLYSNIAHSLPIIAELGRGRPFQFVSLAQLHRGIVSDLINFIYLQNVNDAERNEGDLNETSLKIECDVLDQTYVNAFEKLLRCESKILNYDPEKFRLPLVDQYPQLYGNDKQLKKISELRDEPQKLKLVRWFNLPDQNLKQHIDQEAGKLKFIKYQKLDELNFIYTYFSQFHHYSPASFRFVVQDGYKRHNALLTPMVLYFTIKSIQFAIDQIDPTEVEDLNALEGIAVALSEESKQHQNK